MFKSRKVFVVLLCAFFALLSLSVSFAQDAMTYHQAPSLDDKVASGDLPPVEAASADRPAWSSRRWKVSVNMAAPGTWARAAAAIEVIYVRTVAYQNLLRWNTDWTAVIPDVAKSYDVNDDGTVFTFHLREGMKWSDGEPFTADDILFVINDVYLRTRKFIRPSLRG